MPAKPCVLYIEDDANSRNLVSRILSMDFEIMTAQNGLEGLTLLQRRTPDIVLTDMNLPDLAGEIIAARIRSLLEKPIPIVALTAQTDKTFRQRALAAGCVGYITKPIDVMTLNETVTQYLSGDKVEKLTAGEHKRASQEIQANLTEMLEKTVRQLKIDNEELRSLERAKTAFLTQASHELRTPLTVLSGYVQMLNQLLQGEEVVTEQQRQLASMAVDGVKRLQTVMNEIVVMARLAANQLDAFRAPIRIEDVAKEAISEYQPALTSRNITLETIGDAWSQAFMADATLIRMMLSNLLSNAIKYTPDGRKITLDISRDGEKLHIIVRDQGVGIAPDNMQLLFKPFFTTIDVSRGRTSKTQFMGMGMGMGLTIITKIVEVHKGQLWAESSGYDDKTFPGSTFHVLLPIAEF